MSRRRAERFFSDSSSFLLALQRLQTLNPLDQDFPAWLFSRCRFLLKTLLNSECLRCEAELSELHGEGELTFLDHRRVVFQPSRSQGSGKRESPAGIISVPNVITPCWPCCSAVACAVDDIEMRQGHWAIVDLIGKGGHIRTVPIPGWVKGALDDWAAAARLTQGRIFRAIARAERVWGKGVSQNVVSYVVKTCCERAGLQHIARTICGGPVRSSATAGCRAVG